MQRQFDFSFARSPLAVTPPPPPEDDAILHTLPPEHISMRSSGIRHPPPSGQYVNITLGNSPEYSNSIHLHKPVYTISNFNKKVEESALKIQERPFAGQRQTKGVSSSKVSNKPKDITTYKKTQLVPPKDSKIEKSINESKTEREENSRASASRANAPIHNQSTTRNPREDTLQPQVKRKFTGKPNQTSQSPDKLALVNKIEELKSRITEGENLSKTLGMQLQMTREKLKVRESQQSLLHQRLEALMREIQAGKQTERQLLEQRRMNEYFCEEIDKQKAEVVRYEQKNQQSLRLLQQLNENIAKRQDKLKKELAEQINSFHKVNSDKQDVEVKLNQALQRITNLQDQLSQQEENRTQRQKANQKNDQKMQLMQQEYELRKIQHIQMETNLRLTKEEFTSLRASLQDSNQQKQKLLMELGKLQEENSHLKEKIETLSAANTTAAENHNIKVDQLTTLYEETVRDLKSRLSNYENELERTIYSAKQSQTQLQVANSAINQYIAQIRELKEEKRTLQLEKEELKGDVKHLIDKNDQYYSNIEAGKRRELDLNNSLSDLQKQIISLEQRITQDISSIADRDLDICTLKEQLARQQAINEEYVKTLEGKNNKIAELEEKLRKYERMLAIYKEELSRQKENKQAQWQEMRSVYEEQIAILEEKLKEFLENKEKQRGRSVVKTTRREVTEEIISSSSSRVVTQREQHNEEESLQPIVSSST